jgi:hypothetical protein
VSRGLLVSVVAVLALFASAGGAIAARTASAAPCRGQATGAPWSDRGQKGTAHTVLGVNGASCSLGARWRKRITISHGTRSPAGWMCLASAGVGECQVKGGGSFEFTPKLKK